MTGMVVIREVSPDDWEIMRDVRLAALREAPYAFGSDYAREADFTEARWRARIHDRSVTYLAYLASSPEPAGLAGVYEEDDGAAQLVSMWVRPVARGRLPPGRTGGEREGSVGEALVTACAGWARARGHVELFLWVTESNAPARRLYERCGFAPTGQRQPLPSDPSLPEIRMRLAL